MTDKPTPEQIQRACDLAKGYTPDAYGRNIENRAFTALANTIAELDAKDAAITSLQKCATEAERLAERYKAERDKACADLGKIDRIAIRLGWKSNIYYHDLRLVDAIVAPYRVETDPLVEEAENILQAFGPPSSDADTLALIAVALKRGLEIGRSA